MSRLEPLDRLMRALQKLPGIGPRSAERIAFHLLRAGRDEVQQLADAIIAMKTSVRHCELCFNLTDQARCSICTDERRRREELWVVEQPDISRRWRESGPPTLPSTR
jgi:recombination protein RecR